MSLTRRRHIRDHLSSFHVMASTRGMPRRGSRGAQDAATCSHVTCGGHLECCGGRGSTTVRGTRILVTGRVSRASGRAAVGAGAWLAALRHFSFANVPGWIMLVSWILIMLIIIVLSSFRARDILANSVIVPWSLAECTYASSYSHISRGFAFVVLVPHCTRGCVSR
jgi:hypothetical protein